MNRMIRRIIICAFVFLCLLCGCGNRNGSAQNPDGSEKEQDWRDYNGKRIGVLIGTPMEKIAKDYFPDSEYVYLESYPDCNAALLSGKIDAYLGDEPGIKTIHMERPFIDYIHERITDQDYSFAFRKNDPQSAILCDQFNDFLDKIREDGTFQEIENIWFGNDEEKKVVDMSDLTGKNGKIKVITTSTDMPWSYIKDGKNVGYDIDIVVRFCREKGYALELGEADFGGRIPAVQSGKYDFSTDMNVTPEREEEVMFSKPTSNGGVVLAIPADGQEKGEIDRSTIITSVSQLNDPSYTIGVGSGDACEKVAREALPKAKFLYVDGVNMYKTLQTKKVDALASDHVAMQIAMNNGVSGVRLLDETLGEDIPIAVGISPKSKIPDLQENINRFIDEIRNDGTLDDMYERWVVKQNRTMPDITGPSSPTQHLTVGTTGLVCPYTYYEGTQLSGYDIELAKRFAAWLNADIEFKVYDYGAIVVAVSSGNVDCAMANLNVTPERKEKMIFSEPLFVNRTGIMVREKAANTEENSFIDGIVDSFKKTFIRENRWKLFVYGIGTTLLITVLSILFGTALGFATYMVCRSGNTVALHITRFAVWLVQGMPIVVFLMILYYVIFGSVNISGTVVAVIGFTLVFGAAVYGQLCIGVNAVDKGQMEGALSLGYGSTRAFFRIILPQAIPHVLPVYRGEIVALIKATSIVGYIAVQDLTRMGDLVRSRTYEAFFPLISVAVIYFILAGLLTFAVRKLTAVFDRERSTDRGLLKGVKLHD